MLDTYIDQYLIAGSQGESIRDINSNRWSIDYIW